MNKTALFAILLSALALSSFHQPDRQAIAMASTAQRSISSVIHPTVATSQASHAAKTHPNCSAVFSHNETK